MRQVAPRPTFFLCFLPDNPMQGRVWNTVVFVFSFFQMFYGGNGEESGSFFYMYGSAV